MPLNPRNFTLPGQWAAGASVNIPIPPIKGVNYRDTTIDASNLESGQGYFVAFDSARWNQLLYMVTGLLMQFESNGFATWSPYTNYEANTGMAFGTDGVLHVATAPSGPQNGGDRNPTSTTGYWQTFADYIFAGGGGMGFFSPGDMDLSPFRVNALKPGWYFCNGERYANGTPQAAVLSGLPASYKTDWGITDNGSGINVPMLFAGEKGYFLRPVNGTSRLPGSVEQDAMRQITATAAATNRGTITATGTFWNIANFYGNTPLTPNGVFTTSTATQYDGNYESGNGPDFTVQRTTMNISQAVPNPTLTVTINQSGTVADENRPINIGMTPVIYLGV
jgi:hypothetical protein